MKARRTGKTVPVMANVAPWNEAILRGMRTFKTLHFNWSHRGPILLYNSHGKPHGDLPCAMHDIDAPAQPLGVIVGVVDVVSVTDAREDDGYYVVNLGNPRRLGKPFPYKPKRGAIRISKIRVTDLPRDAKMALRGATR